MVSIKNLIVLWLQFLLVDMNSRPYQKPVAQVVWPGRCTQQSRALNDCNWCRCNSQHEYNCDARTCSYVDMFGHFNDAIRDIDVGMEGRGVWRSTATACEPGVKYNQGSLLCVCTDDGTWPNPVCRDIFRVLHSVELTGDAEVTGQKCSSTKLYLVGCNVCFCPSSGVLEPHLCTKKECSKDDPVLKAKDDTDIASKDQMEQEIYAECNTNHQYKLGCKTCTCLRNNRLHCGNCSFSEEKSIQSFCSKVEPQHTFNVGCNMCFCDEKRFAYCSTKKCLLRQTGITVRSLPEVEVLSQLPSDEENCIPGHTYKHGCNKCYCDFRSGKKVFACTVKKCARTVNPHEDILDCVNGTSYELNCKICECYESNGVKIESCYVNPECKNKNSFTESRSQDLDSLHGYCEPLHVYKKGCNTCHCLTDGKTVRCTSYICKDPVQEPVIVDIVPVVQNGAACPAGFSYKVECNYCFCLSNGNAICTTYDCRRRNN